MVVWSGEFFCAHDGDTHIDNNTAERLRAAPDGTVGIEGRIKRILKDKIKKRKEEKRSSLSRPRQERKKKQRSWTLQEMT